MDLSDLSEAEARAARWLTAWDSQGPHRTATTGDDAGADWLAAEAAALGAEPKFESFTLNRLDPIQTFLEIDGERIAAVPLFDAPSTDAAGISGSMVSQLERGRTTYTQATLQKVAEALGVQPWKLLAAGPAEDQRLWTVVLQASLPEMGLELDETSAAHVSLLISNNYRAAIMSACHIYGKPGPSVLYDQDDFPFKWESQPPI